jgi:F-type H+-transporting ATPase subunit gamma
MVAAAKLRKAQAAAEAARPYAQRMASVMASLAGKVAGHEGAPALLAGTGKDQRHLLVVANSDKGLAGAFNSNIVRAALAKARELQAAGKTVEFYLVGRKGRAPIARDYGKQIVKHFDTTTVREPGYAEAEQVAAELLAMYESGKFDVAHLFFSKFRSALLQEPTEQQIIPVPAPKVEAAGAGAAVEYEPDEEEILAELLPRYLKTQLFGALLENTASEQGASMTAMDNATRNAGDLINKLTIQYNRSRQAAITTELIEIIAGAEAL